MTPEELREAVAKAILFADSPTARERYKSDVWNNFTDGTRLKYLTQADAAIALVIEEAALACEVRWLQKGQGIGKDYAATIRAIVKPTPGS